VASKLKRRRHVSARTWWRRFAKAARFCHRHKAAYGGFRACMRKVLG
jgi:hypothetical protein